MRPRPLCNKVSTLDFVVQKFGTATLISVLYSLIEIIIIIYRNEYFVHWHCSIKFSLEIQRFTQFLPRNNSSIRHLRCSRPSLTVCSLLSLLGKRSSTSTYFIVMEYYEMRFTISYAQYICFPHFWHSYFLFQGQGPNESLPQRFWSK